MKLKSLSQLALETKQSRKATLRQLKAWNIPNLIIQEKPGSRIYVNCNALKKTEKDELPNKLTDLENRLEHLEEKVCSHLCRCKP